MKRNAFTLVELLVVVAIIALLISILLPALSKARDIANTVVCLSQQKQIAMAIRMYACDNEDWLPEADKIDRNLESYNMDRDTGSRVWTCPSRNRSLSYVTEANPVSYCFSLNTLVWVNTAGGRKLCEICNHSRALIGGDGRENFSWGAWIFIDSTGELPYYSPSGLDFNDETWFNNNGHTTSDAAYVEQADVDAEGGPSGIRYRHNDNERAAAVFMDGHSESVAKWGLTKGNFVTKW